MVYNVVSGSDYSKVIQLYIYIYLLFFRFLEKHTFLIECQQMSFGSLENSQDHTENFVCLWVHAFWEKGWSEGACWQTEVPWI